MTSMARGIFLTIPPWPMRTTSVLRNTRYHCPWRVTSVTPPLGPLPLIEGLEKRIGLRNGGFHGANQGGNLRFHCHPFLP
jgi:hypothetical protein